MITKDKYNERLQEIIDSLTELKITDRYMREDNRVTCLGGTKLMLGDLIEETEYEMAIPTIEGTRDEWVSQKQIDNLE